MITWALLIFPLERSQVILVLTRRIGEVIHISPNIIVQIIEIQGGKVRLGIVAPDKSVYRKEMYDKIKEDKENKNESQS